MEEVDARLELSVMRLLNASDRERGSFSSWSMCVTRKQRKRSEELYRLKWNTFAQLKLMAPPFVLVLAFLCQRVSILCHSKNRLEYRFFLLAIFLLFYFSFPSSDQPTQHQNDERIIARHC
jgi:hypothetical protein